MKIKRIFLLICFCFFAGMNSYAQSIQDAIRLMEVEQFGKAKKMLMDLQRIKSSSENLYYQGEICFLSGKIDSAKIFYEKGLALDPESALNMVGVGKVSYQNNPSEGKQYFDKALLLTKSKDAQVLAAIAQCYLSAEKPEYSAAIDLMTKAIDRDERKAEYYILLGDAHWSALDGSAAVKQYEKALELNPKLAKAFLRLGNTFIRVKNYNVALDYFNKAIEADPQYAPAYREIGELYYKAGKYDKAIHFYDKYVEMTDPSDETDFRYAAFSIQTKDYDKAITLLEKLQKEISVNPFTYRLLAYAYYEKGEHAKGLKSMEYFMKLVRVEEYIPQDYEYYGRLLLKSGKDSLAIENMKLAVQKDSSKISLYSEIGNIYFRSKKYEQAVAAYQKSLSAQPAATDYLSLGRAYYYLKDYGKADAAFEQLTKIAPAYQGGFLWRARANSGLDPESVKGLAKPFYEKFIELSEKEKDKFKNDMVEAYSYLGYYYMVSKDNLQSREMWMNARSLDPGNKRAEDALKILDQ